jgi:hypothetical protein
MNEIDQIDQVALSYEVSDEAVEVDAMREGAGAWTFVCTMDCNVIEPEPSLRVLPYDRSRFKAQPLGDRFKDGRLGGGGFRGSAVRE